jgi:hypothetical protein
MSGFFEEWLGRFGLRWRGNAVRVGARREMAWQVWQGLVPLGRLGSGKARQVMVRKGR